MAKRKRTTTANPPLSHKHTLATRLPIPPHSKVDAAALPITPTSVHSILPSEDLEIAVETLQTLTRYPALLKSKACKELRTAVYDFRQACTTGLNSVNVPSVPSGNGGGSWGLTARISAALTDGKFTDALVCLAEMRIRGETPTLGALCRWVRELDVISGLSKSQQTTGWETGNMERMRVLDAVLRVTGPIDPNPVSSQGGGAIALQDVWDLRGSSTSVSTDEIPRIPVSTHQFRILETTPGPLRKPPNLHPAVLFTSDNTTIPLAIPPRDTERIPSLHHHPIVPNLSLIRNLLSPSECAAIISAGEAVEFIPDAPIRTEGEENSILAHNFYWLVDQAFHDVLWCRVRPLLPERVAGKRIRGINRRFRVYRYVPGAEYRCHIDGAWPPSGTDKLTGRYLYDASAAADVGDRQSSLFTFLIYLNDNFTGGETTFFLPSAREGVMNAYPVKPIQGSVVFFPHGGAEGALLHEGTGVIEGAKYVVRTDVEYDIHGS
ncbi:hypothetical protein K431DRAFT_235304 [Polychaeton citri CBS 116435]|uniref:Fe2OG dioxygenase domain-containing protein n=1 Tax=Polychaeton citri CBS 116435 TaxID=1314669 RepID=A0A9P4PZ71_9PEZI|nr:hypothetical protein K431DRAFT_235304 [Polychaeton citri CBS 116435]